MLNLSDAELTRRAQSPESLLVERKEGLSNGRAIRRTLCAFANDLAASGEPGVIFVGLKDNGECAGTTVDDALLVKLATMRSDGSILPMPSINVAKKIIQDCELAVIVVAPSSDTPVRYDGRVWVKVGPTVQQASPQEENQLAEKRRSADLPFDRRPSSASVEDLDLDYFANSYLPNAIAPDVLARNARAAPEQLRSLHLVMDDYPTYGGLMACGRDARAWLPGAYVQFLRFAGPEMTDAIQDQKALVGKLEDVLRQLDDLFRRNISMATDITSRDREIRRPDYPLAALQQLARNAVMHRSYEGTNAPIRIHWFADRIEIVNPGGLYGAVTPHNLGQGVTDYRNPLIAESMHHLGFAQRFGIGLPTARQALRDNGNPPLQFQFPELHFVVSIRPAR